ncbi:MAG: DMT family transporter [Bacteroidia bacterium]|nr:DMT family transporter [Bacteroidia bacterium]
MKQERSADLQMHFVVLLWGFTAILGKLISLSGPVLVWHRLWITVFTLMCIPGVWKHIRAFKRRQVLHLAIIGILTALHWVCFYGSIKMADSASVALSALATGSFFAAILEPLITRTRFDWINIFLGLMVFTGVRFIYADSAIDPAAFSVGILAAFLAALFSTLNKKYATGFDARAATAVELGFGFLFLSLLLPVFESPESLPEVLYPKPADWLWLIILSVVCTALTFVLALHCLKYISAFKSNLYVNMEPVYGIIMAALIFNEAEDLGLPFFIGAAVIISAVFIKPLLKTLVQQIF